MSVRWSQHWPKPIGERRRPHVPTVGDRDGASNPMHTHRLPRILVFVLVAFSVIQVLTLVAIGLLAVFVYQDHQYVVGRGEFRDAETKRLEEEIRLAQCELLDGLPADWVALDPLRAENNCGPGLALDELAPEVRRDIEARRQAPSVDPGDALPGPAVVTPRPGSVGPPVPPAEPPSQEDA